MAQFNNIPSNILFALDEIEKAGYEAFLVGGAVRDLMMDVEPHDYDVATSATPEQVMEVFSTYTVIPTGIQHGTVTVLLDDDIIQVTTYRTEGKYSDSRHPDSVQYVKSLAEDLSRRDFTMNAMAYRPRDGRLVDLCGGAHDLMTNIIRCVGNPWMRFNEDPLRIMRMFRMYLKPVGKKSPPRSIDSETLRAAIDVMPKLTEVSAERTQDELNQILLLINLNNYKMPDVFNAFQTMIQTIIPEIAPCIDFEQNNPYHDLTVFRHSLKALAFIDGDARQALVLKLALLLHDIGKPECYTYNKESGIAHFYGHSDVSQQIAAKVLTRLRYSSHTICQVLELIGRHEFEIPQSRASVNRLANKLHYTDFVTLMQMRRCDIMAQNPLHLSWAERLERADKAAELYEKMLDEQDLFTLKNLAIDGSDVMALGVPEGKEVGQWLRYALEQVMDGHWENDKYLLRGNLQACIIKEAMSDDSFTA